MRPVPNIKAAMKSVRQAEKRTERNLSAKTRLKTLHKKAVQAPDAQFTRTVEAQFDKAASKGVIHPNKAARKKSRLAKALKAITAQPAAAKTKTKTPARRKATTRKTTVRPAARKKS